MKIWRSKKYRVEYDTGDIISFKAEISDETKIGIITGISYYNGIKLKVLHHILPKSAGDMYRSHHVIEVGDVLALIRPITYLDELGEI